MSAPDLGGPPEVPNIAVSSSTAAIQEDFARFVRDMQAGRVHLHFGRRLHGSARRSRPTAC